MQVGMVELALAWHGVGPAAVGAARGDEDLSLDEEEEVAHRVPALENHLLRRRGMV